MPHWHGWVLGSGGIRPHQVCLQSDISSMTPGPFFPVAAHWALPATSQSSPWKRTGGGGGGKGARLAVKVPANLVVWSPSTRRTEGERSSGKWGH